MTDGIVVVYKERGWTSFDVVAKLRSVLKIKKIGHTGTLDPDAEGVLVLCVGKATKLVQSLTGHDKEYRATLLFGKKTDTGDVSGRILQEGEVRFSEEEARRAALSFVGGYDQIPPMYSAKKVGGRKLYELAREGITVERTPVFVSISSLTVEEVLLPRMRFSVACGKGTYIRTLCEDIGEKLGCPACMESLIRSKVGEYGLSDAKKISEIEKLMKESGPEAFMIPIPEGKMP